jgi:hypothetical protein
MAGRQTTYTVKFKLPNSTTLIEIKQGDEYDSVTITRLMNFVCFVSE